MGNLLNVINNHMIDLIFGKQEAGVLMVGLDSAGKTTVLYKFKLGEVVETIPTIGFNVETLEYKNLSFTVFDVGGQNKIRPLWKHYYENANAIIFVVDSHDLDRIDQDEDSAAEELAKLLKEPTLSEAPLLVFANKQDLKGALPLNELAQRLRLTRLKRKWKIQATIATQGSGLYEGLDWLAQVVGGSQ